MERSVVIVLHVKLAYQIHVKFLPLLRLRGQHVHIIVNVLVEHVVLMYALKKINE